MLRCPVFLPVSPVGDAGLDYLGLQMVGYKVGRIPSSRPVPSRSPYSLFKEHMGHLMNPFHIPSSV